MGPDPIVKEFKEEHEADDCHEYKVTSFPEEMELLMLDM